MKLIPMTLKKANSFIGEIHRHNNPVQGHKFSVGVIDEEGALRGVVIVGRPLSRMLDDGVTLEVLRVATDGYQNACSKLYGAAKKAGFSMGYSKIITYTLEEECGSSLKASGFQEDTLVQSTIGWDRSNRPRPTQLRLDGRPIRPLGNKRRWSIEV